MPRKGFTSEQIVRLLKEAEILAASGMWSSCAVPVSTKIPGVSLEMGKPYW